MILYGGEKRQTYSYLLGFMQSVLDTYIIIQILLSVIFNPCIVAKESMMYDPTAIKILDIKVTMPLTVKEM